MTCKYYNNGNIGCTLEDRTSECFSCAAMNSETFITPKDQLFNFVDVHTTGKPIHFTSKKQWEDHLKKHGKYQLSNTDIKNLTEPKPKYSSGYKKVVEQAWVEREKFVMDYKYKRRPYYAG